LSLLSLNSSIDISYVYKIFRQSLLVAHCNSGDNSACSSGRSSSRGSGHSRVLGRVLSRALGWALGRSFSRTFSRSLSRALGRAVVGTASDQAGVEDVRRSLVLSGSDGFGLGAGAISNDGGIGLARISEALADEAGDDTDLLGRAVVEVGVVGRLEGSLLAIIQTRSEDNGRVTAAAERTGGLTTTKSATAAGGLACLELLLAFRGLNVQLARVDCVEALVVLDIT
jgi:hypothetical protein